MKTTYMPTWLTAGVLALAMNAPHAEEQQAVQPHTEKVSAVQRMKLQTTGNVREAIRVTNRTAALRAY